MFEKTLHLLNKIGIKRLLIMVIPFITIIGFTIAASGGCASATNGTISCWQ